MKRIIIRVKVSIMYAKNGIQHGHSVHKPVSQRFTFKSGTSKWLSCHLLIFRLKLWKVNYLSIHSSRFLTAPVGSFPECCTSNWNYSFIQLSAILLTAKSEGQLNFIIYCYEDVSDSLRPQLPYELLLNLSLVTRFVRQNWGPHMVPVAYKDWIWNKCKSCPFFPLWKPGSYLKINTLVSKWPRMTAIRYVGQRNNCLATRVVLEEYGRGTCKYVRISPWKWVNISYVNDMMISFFEIVTICISFSIF